MADVGRSRRQLCIPVRAGVVVGGLLVLYGALLLGTLLSYRTPQGLTDTPAASPRCRSDAREADRRSTATGPPVAPPPTPLALRVPGDATATVLDMGRHGYLRQTILLSTSARDPAAVPPEAGAPSTTTTVPPTTTPSSLPPSLGPPTRIPVRVLKEVLRRKEKNAQIEPGAYTVVATQVGPRSVELVVCVDRNHPHLDPGSYVGAISFDNDPRIAPLSVPITVRVQYQHLWWMILVALPIVLLGGIVFVYSSGRGGNTASLQAEAECGFVKGAWDWTVEHLVRIGAAVAAAAVAFTGGVLANPSWGWEAPAQWFTALGTVFAAFTAALSAASATISRKAATQRGEPEAGEHGSPVAAGDDPGGAREGAAPPAKPDAPR